MVKIIPTESSKPQSLRVLMVEDSEDDALLMIRELKKGGYKPVYERVETAAAMKKALQENPWDIILCDYRLPQFSAPLAIAMLKEIDIDIPLIIVSGAIDEETALESMRLGAQDYIMKGKLSRLCSAIAKELKDAEVRVQRNRAIDDLRENEIKYRVLFESAGDAIFMMDKDILIDCNQKTLGMFGCTREQIIGQTPYRFSPDVQPDGRNSKEKPVQHINETIKRQPQLFEWQHCRYDGTIFDAEVSINSFNYGSKYYIQAIVRDITERKQMEETIRQSEERYRTILEEMADSYYEVDLAGNFNFMNDTMCQQLGYAREELLGTSFQINVVKEDVDHIYQTFAQIYKTGNPKRDIAYRILHRDGTIRFVENSAFPIHNQEGVIIGFRGIGRDVTERKRNEEKIQYLATHDFLTGLPNRMMFGQLLQQAVQTAKRYQKQFAVLFIDLDGFKEINDRMGHEAGDQFLKEIATRLKNDLRAADVAARLGGDEFVVLVEEVADSGSVATVARKINDSIAQPLTIHGCEQRITASIGISLYPSDADEGPTLMTLADRAMYAAKLKGKNQYQLFTENR